MLDKVGNDENWSKLELVLFSVNYKKGFITWKTEEYKYKYQTAKMDRNNKYFQNRN